MTDPGDLQARLDAAISRHGVPGASAAVFYQGEFATAAAGRANLASEVEMTSDTVMHIGSITKVLNTTLVLQLVDEGAIELERPIVDYLPEFQVADPDATKSITVKMCLNHTSGIDGEMLPDQGHDEETIEKAVRRFAPLGQLHHPGEDFSYCNAGMVIAGRLVEEVTRQSWYDCVKEKIFAPLEMEHSVVLPEDALLHRASVGHHRRRRTGELRRTSFAFLPLSFAPAGSTAMTSAGDLVTFSRAHLADGVGPNGTRILSEASALAMRRPTARYKGPGFGEGIGLGWMLAGDGQVHHGGGGPGIVSWLTASPRKNFAAAVLTNAEHGLSVIDEVVRPWLDETGSPSPLGADLPEPIDEAFDPSPYLGVYRNVTTEYEVVPHEGSLAVTVQFGHTFYDSTPTRKSRPMPLERIGESAFMFRMPAELAAANPPGVTVFAFVNPARDCRPEHLATGGRLYRRTA